MVGRCSFWLLVVVLTFAWLVNGFDFYCGVPQGDGYLWRDIESFPWVYRILRDASDVAVMWPFASVTLCLTVYAANMWLVARIWTRPTQGWRAVRDRLCVAAPSIGVQVAYLAIVCSALEVVAERLSC